MYLAPLAQSGAKTVSPADTLLIEWETPLPATLAIGAGAAYFLSGWCFHPAQPIRHLVGVVIQPGPRGQRVFPLTTQGVLGHDLPPALQQHARAEFQRSSSFWTLLTLAEDDYRLSVGDEIEIRLRATLNDGSVIEQVIARPRIEQQRKFPVELRSGFPPPGTPQFPATADARSAAATKVAICMATYNPDPAMFRRQIASIQAQTHANWICLISDDGSDEPALRQMLDVIGMDERFYFYPFAERLNFYHNFERALTLTPAEADFIALADQDDYWYPHKLATLVAHCDETAQLAYSDLRLTTPDGTVLCDTYWTHRRNNFDKLGPMLLMNTVPGASALFRRSLLEGLLPFPPPLGPIFHDQWLSVLALARGPLNYVPEPLYDYVQHNANIVGYAEQGRQPWRALLRYCYQHLATSDGRRAAQQLYFTHIPRIALFARVAALRTRQQTTRRKQRILERASRLDYSWRSMLWLLAQGLRDWRTVGLTNGTEYYLLSAICWRQFAWLRSWWRR